DGGPQRSQQAPTGDAPDRGSELRSTNESGDAGHGSLHFSGCRVAWSGTAPGAGCGWAGFVGGVFTDEAIGGGPGVSVAVGRAAGWEARMASKSARVLN